jgi:hypothetical protein
LAVLADRELNFEKKKKKKKKMKKKKEIKKKDLDHFHHFQNS